MYYLSGCFSNELINERIPRVGVMSSPDIGNRIPQGMVWAADNGCYSQGKNFKLTKFMDWLTEHEQKKTCLWAVAPDVVGDASATITRSLPVLPQIREMGYAAAMTAQDGLESLDIPWDEFDCLFIGGTTAWKLSPAAWEIGVRAQERGKWLHMGRVNSERRFKAAMSRGCDSVDGTFLAFGPKKNWPILKRWLTWEPMGLT